MHRFTGSFRLPPGGQPGAAWFPSRKAGLRTPFERDRDRIIHCQAFRRLKHKTQVFVYHEGDHYRTRLTHTIEVAQIARSIARALGLDEDLAEALALAHDLGHTPFGHAGERELDQLMRPYRRLRPQCPVAAHPHPARAPLCRLRRPEPDLGDAGGPGQAQWPAGRTARAIPSAATASTACREAIVEYAAGHDLELHSFASAEAQVAAIADDIAYNAHDIDDGLRAGLFDLIDLGDVPLAGEALARGAEALSRPRADRAGARDGAPGDVRHGRRRGERDAGAARSS